jgi:hypothetical protein
MARPPRSRAPAFKRGVSGVRGASAPATPAPIYHVEGDDAVFAASSITSWPARVGLTATVAAGRGSPQQGSTANGHQGVQFRRTQGDQLAVGNIQPSASDYTVQIVWQPTANSRSGDREYFLRSWAVQDTDDIIIPHLANLGSTAGYSSGFFDGAAGAESDPGGGWHHFRNANWRATNVKVPGSTALHVDTWILRAGDCRLYRNGVLMGSNVNYTPRAMTDLHMGGTKGSAPPLTYFDGTVYQVKVWNRALLPGTVTSEQLLAMARFGIAAAPTAPTPATIFGANLLALYDPSDLYYVEYSETRALAAIANRVDTSLYLATQSGTTPAYEPNGLNGKPTISITAGQGLIANALAAAIFDGSPPTGVTIFAVVKNKSAGGQNSSDGKIASFGHTAANPRHELLLVDGPAQGSRHVRSLRLDDAGTSRSALPLVDPLLAQHLIIGTQDETGDTATVEIDASITTSSVVNLGATTLSTFAIGHRRTTVNTDTTAYFDIACVGVIDRVLTTPERVALRTWATAHWATP